jgi:hypothetical protein
MKKLFRLIVTLLLIGGWSLAAGALHVVNTGSAVIVLPKDRLGLRDTYVNINGWTVDDVSNHPLIASRLLSTGKVETLAPIYQKTGDELVKEVQDTIAKGPTSQPSPTIIEKAKEVAQQSLDKVQR